MPAAEARIPTRRAERYLAQLTSHVGHMRRGHFGGRRHHDGSHVAPEVQHVSLAGSRAVITFDWGVCTATAESGALTLLADARDSAGLERGQELLTRRVRTIGRREDLTVTWHPTDDRSS
jgi:hypothetical protein